MSDKTSTDQQSQGSLQPDGSMGARDWHWTLRSMEIPLTRLCVDCGENIPSGGSLCEDCLLDAMDD